MKKAWLFPLLICVLQGTEATLTGGTEEIYDNSANNIKDELLELTTDGDQVTNWNKATTPLILGTNNTTLSLGPTKQHGWHELVPALATPPLQPIFLPDIHSVIGLPPIFAEEIPVFIASNVPDSVTENSSPKATTLHQEDDVNNALFTKEQQFLAAGTTSAPEYRGAGRSGSISAERILLPAGAALTTHDSHLDGPNTIRRNQQQDAESVESGNLVLSTQTSNPIGRISPDSVGQGQAETPSRTDASSDFATSSEPTTRSSGQVRKTTSGIRIFGIRPPLLEELLREMEEDERMSSQTESPDDRRIAPVLSPRSSNWEHTENVTSVTPGPETKLENGSLSQATEVIPTTSTIESKSQENQTQQNHVEKHGLTTDSSVTTRTARPASSGVHFKTNTTTGDRGYIYRLCGYPPVCNYRKCRNLNRSIETLEKCEIAGAKLGFIAIVFVMALGIIFGNSLLPLVVWRNRDMRAPHNLMKVSLAVADAITGFILLFSVIPNIFLTMTRTEEELVQMDQQTINSVQAIIAGSMLTLSAQASLFHLTFLSIERFVAIKWPLWHRFKAPGSISTQIATIWAISLIAACLPAAFTEAFEFRYIPVLYVYMLTTSATNYTRTGTIYLVFTMVLPFVASIILTTVTGMVVWRKMKATAHMRQYSSRRSRRAPEMAEEGHNGITVRRTKIENEAVRKKLRPEMTVLKTIAIMICAFCVTLLPFIIMVYLTYTGYYDCSTYSIPYASSFYACMSNSFINVLIYTVRDRKFRAALAKLLKISGFDRLKSRNWRTHKTKSTAVGTSTTREPTSSPPGRSNRQSGKERWERALVGK